MPVCVGERERERERETIMEADPDPKTFLLRFFRSESRNVSRMQFVHVAVNPVCYI